MDRYIYVNLRSRNDHNAYVLCCSCLKANHAMSLGKQSGCTPHVHIQSHSLVVRHASPSTHMGHFEPHNPLECYDSWWKEKPHYRCRRSRPCMSGTSRSKMQQPTMCRMGTAAVERKASSNRHIDHKRSEGEAYNVCITNRRRSLSLPTLMIK